MPRRQRSAWGSVTKRRPGTYLVRWMGDARDGKGYRRLSKTVRGTRKEAQELLARMQLEHSGDKPAPTVREVFERWYWPDCTARLKKQSLRQYGSWWRCVEARWGGLPVTDVRPLDVQEWLSGMSKGQAEGAMKVMKPLMDYPLRYGIIDANPLRMRYVMPTRVERRDAGIYSLPELEAIAEAARGSRVESAVILAAFGSARVGESLAPTVADVEEVVAENGMRCACVRVAAQMDNSGELVGNLKNEQSARWLVVPEPWSARLLEIADERIGEGTQFLADDLCGGCVAQHAMLREWRGIVGRAGLPYHPFRSVRPSWRTYMSWDLHVEPERLEKLMGHKGSGVTDRHYNRPIRQMLVNEIAEAFAARAVPTS